MTNNIGLVLPLIFTQELLRPDKSDGISGTCHLLSRHPPPLIRDSDRLIFLIKLNIN